MGSGASSNYKSCFEVENNESVYEPDTHFEPQNNFNAPVTEINPEKVEARWRMMPKPEEARQHYIDEGTLDENCTMAHVELRALLDDPISQRMLASHVKQAGLLCEFMCWIDLVEYRSIKTQAYRMSKALHIHSKYVDKNAILPLHPSVFEGAIDRDDMRYELEAASENDTDSVISAVFFDTLRDQCFHRIYDVFFKNFKETEGYYSVTKALHRRYNYVQESDFEYIRKLGQGTYGIVVHCKKKSTGKDYAMKIQLKSSLLSNFKDDPRRVENEKRAAAACTHPFIIALEYAFQTETLAMMVLSLGTGGDLNDALRNSPGGVFGEDRSKFYCAEIICALSHIHSMGLIYRDLKPGNVLLNADGHIKLVDLGAVADVEGDALSFSSKGKQQISPLFHRRVTISQNPNVSNLRKKSISQDIFSQIESVAKLQAIGIKQSAKERSGSLSNSSGKILSVRDIEDDDEIKGSCSIGASIRTGNTIVVKGTSSFKVPQPTIEEMDAQADITDEERYSSGKDSRPPMKRARSIIGTFGYMAPEMVIILAQYSNEIVGYTYSVDWWSLGVCLYKFLCGVRPFSEHSMTRLINQAPSHHGTYEFSKKYAILFQEIQFTDDVSGAARDLISKMLDVNPETRIGSGHNGLKNLKNHPFFGEIDWNLLEEKLVEPPCMPAADDIETAPRYSGFDDMLRKLHRERWLSTYPSKDAQKYFDKWNYTATKTLKAECGLAGEMSRSSSSLRVKFSSKKLSMGLSAADNYMPEGYNKNTNIVGKQRRPQRVSMLASIPSVANLSRMLSTASLAVSERVSTIGDNISAKLSSKGSPSPKRALSSRKINVRARSSLDLRNYEGDCNSEHQ